RSGIPVCAIVRATIGPGQRSEVQCPGEVQSVPRDNARYEVPFSAWGTSSRIAASIHWGIVSTSSWS
ncbi:MAG TPA: hypothetical protein VFJ47_16195, partial [Terriglobales bacterium]|nr:hypothetical protein [Terriglobales bacterium]